MSAFNDENPGMTDEDVALTDFSLSYLESLPDLSTGQADSLKIERPSVRVWLSRCGTEDGMPFDHAVMVERIEDGRWRVSRTYRATGQRRGTGGRK